MLRATLRALGEAPTRSVTALAQRLGVAEAAALAPASPLVATKGTARRLERPQDPPEQTRGDRGKHQGHPVKHVLWINAALPILLRRATYAGSRHDQRMADATPYPGPAGSRLLQDLGCLACTLNQVESIMPTKKPRGRPLTRAQQTAHRCIAHVNSRVERCRIVPDTCRLRKAGVCDLLMEVCCAWHTFRGRLTPWPPMV